MKRIASCLLSVIIALSGITALAAEPEVKDVYNHSDNSVSAKEAGVTVNYSTVMIKSASENSDVVVYLNQESGGFTDLTTFLMKDGCDNGNYIATFGNEKGETKIIEFFKGDVPLTGNSMSVVLNTAQKMTVKDEATKQTGNEARDASSECYRKGFTLLVESVQTLENVNTVYLVSSNGKTCYGYFELVLPETVVTGGNIAYGLQLFNIPEDKKDLNLYLGGAPK